MASISQTREYRRAWYHANAARISAKRREDRAILRDCKRERGIGPFMGGTDRYGNGKKRPLKYPLWKKFYRPAPQPITFSPGTKQARAKNRPPGTFIGRPSRLAMSRQRMIATGGEAPYGFTKKGTPRLRPYTAAQRAAAEARKKR